MDRVEKLKSHLAPSNGGGVAAVAGQEATSKTSQRRVRSQGVEADLHDTDGGRNPETHHDGWGYSVRERRD